MTSRTVEQCVADLARTCIQEWSRAGAAPSCTPTETTTTPSSPSPSSPSAARYSTPPPSSTSVEIEKTPATVAAAAVAAAAATWTSKSTSIVQSSSCTSSSSSSSSSLDARCVLKATIMEGNRKEGMSPGLFEYMYNVLTAMPCFEATGNTAPWSYHVLYDLPPTMLEKDVEPLRERSHRLRTQLHCNADGDDARLVVAYEEKPPLHIGIGKFATLSVCIDRECVSRNYIKKNTNFTKISVEARKTFTFKEHYDWQYTFILKYREPYYETQDLMKDLTENDMTFRDPPVCLFDISCSGVKQTLDHSYFADSLLCKMSDLFPPAWKVVPLHVRPSR